MSAMRRVLGFSLVGAMTCLAWARPAVALRSPVARFVAQADLLDINTATAAQLKLLPGMGDAYVRRVIAGRPYTAKNQLVTRGILPREAYEKIQSKIVAHRPAR
jgi:competence protein ComEA